MSEPAGAAGSPIAAEVIPQLAAAAAKIAAAHEERAPASIAAAPTTRVKALVPRHPTFALSPTGTCVARSTRVEEDGFAGGPSVGCAGGPLP